MLLSKNNTRTPAFAFLTPAFTLFLLRKVFFLILSLWIVITLTFFLMKALPGDPFSEEQSLPKEIRETLLRHYGLDRSLPEQYLTYLRSVLKGDLGPSFKYQDRTVNEIIFEYFPVSAFLACEALILSIGSGVLFGALAAINENNRPDRTIQFLTTAGISVPGFILATLLQYTFAMKWELFPLARWESLAHTVLPAIALAAIPTAFITRLMRSGMIEVMQCDYIKTAKAKGLSTRAIIVKHGMKNAFLPIFSYIGQLIANVLIGSFVVEKIFSIPGLGQWFVKSVNHRDYTVIMGLTIFYSTILMTTMLIVDIAYRLLDPRIQTGRR